jgi:hypothetical protein
MERRQVLAAVGALAATGLAGCGGGGTTDTPPTGARVPSGPEDDGDGSGSAGDVGPVTAIPSFEATDFRVSNASGDVRVEVVVQNPAERSRTMILNVSSRTDGGLVTGERELSMDPGTSRTVNVTLPVDYDEWGGSLDFGFRSVE